jgi:DNA-directed RNA polymerase subunit K/omega
MTTSKILDYNDVSFDPAQNTTRNIMTKFEKTAIMSLRLEQLARGAPPCVDAEALGLKTMREIAVVEMDQRKLPFVVMRTLPNNRKEYWKLRDMVILRD